MIDKDEIIEEYSNIFVETNAEKYRTMKEFAQDLKKIGLTDEEIEDEVEGWAETHWSNDDYKDYYGVDTDEDLEEAQDSDDFWD